MFVILAEELDIGTPQLLGIIYLTPEAPSGRYLLVMGITLWF
jgi:hypothetical protein